MMDVCSNRHGELFREGPNAVEDGGWLANITTLQLDGRIAPRAPGVAHDWEHERDLTPNVGGLIAKSVAIYSSLVSANDV